MEKVFSAERVKTRLCNLKKKKAGDDRKHELLAVWLSLFRLMWMLLLCEDWEALEDVWKLESSSDVVAGWAR